MTHCLLRLVHPQADPTPAGAFVPPSPLLLDLMSVFLEICLFNGSRQLDCLSSLLLTFNLVLFAGGQSPSSLPSVAASLQCCLENLFIEYQHDTWGSWNGDSNLGCMQYKHDTSKNVESVCVFIYYRMFIHSLLLSLTHCKLGCQLQVRYHLRCWKYIRKTALSFLGLHGVKER